MYNIIPLLLILVSLSVIIVIVSRKFSVLASLDVDSIPAEKEAKFKERIISNRLKRNIVKSLAKASSVLAPLGRVIGDFFSAKLRKLLEAKDNFSVSETVDAEQTVAQLFSQIRRRAERDHSDVHAVPQLC